MNFQLVYPRELKTILRSQSVLLIDVRSRELYQKEHWPGAKNFPYEELEHWEKMLPGNKRIIFYCEHGGNSMQLARKFGMQGYQVGSVVGGFPAMQALLTS